MKISAYAFLMMVCLAILGLTMVQAAPAQAASAQPGVTTPPPVKAPSTTTPPTMKTPAAPEAPAAPKATVAGVYHGNTESKVFHAPGCRNYNCQNCTATFKNRQEAVAKGYKPCEICKP